MASMEKKEKKSRSQSSVLAEAAGDADEMMRRMLEEAEGTREAGQMGTLEEGPKGSEKGGSGLLENLIPAGPPLSLAPKGSRDVVGTPRESVARGTQRLEQETPEVKRVVVKGSDEPREGTREADPRRPPQEPVRGAVSEHGAREVTGKGRGSGAESKGIGSRDFAVLEHQVGGRLEGTEHFYIGEPFVGVSRSVEVPPRMDDVVNPFWSQERQRGALAGVGVGLLPSHDVRLWGQVGSSQSTPQKKVGLKWILLSFFG